MTMLLLNEPSTRDKLPESPLKRLIEDCVDERVDHTRGPPQPFKDGEVSRVNITRATHGGKEVGYEERSPSD